MSGAVDLISENAVVNANIVTPNDIRIDGVVNGNVHTVKRLVIGPNSVVNGNVIALSVDCFGEINGNVNVVKTLNLKSSGTIIGDIVSPEILIEQGACFCGKCNMGNTP